MKTIRQTATIRGATPHDLYETIMDSKKHTGLWLTVLTLRVPY